MAEGARMAGLLLAFVLASGCAAGSPASSPRGTVTVDGPEIVGLRHAQVGPLSFDYPAFWTLTPVGHPKHYETVLAFLASDAIARESCGPDYVPGMGGGCADTYEIAPGGVVIRLSQLDPPAPAGKGVAYLVAQDVAAGWQARTVAGQPAAYDPAYTDASTPPGGKTVAWFVAGLDAGNTVGYAIVATVNGADPAAWRAVDAIVASLSIAAGR